MPLFCSMRQFFKNGAYLTNRFIYSVVSTVTFTGISSPCYNISIMGGKDRAKSILFLVAAVIFPPLFPYYYVKKIAYAQHARQRKFYIFGNIYLLLWLFIACAALPTVQPPKQDYASNSLHNSYTPDNYEEQSAAYTQKFYEKLKEAQPNTIAATTPTAQTPTTAATNSNQGATQPQATTSPKPTSAATSAMSGIKIAEADNSPYLRANYGKGWNVGTGCNIRSRLLTAQSTVPVKTSDGCLVTYGSWIDPYSGVKLTGNPYQGDGEDNDLDIDHIIPLRYVNQHGGYAWSHTQKQNYGKSLSAMNNGVYIAVSSKENRRKSDQGPADYYPSNPNFYCEYAKRWRNIARTYSISLSQRDYNKIEGVLFQCGIK